eukprot:34548_1
MDIPDIDIIGILLPKHFHADTVYKAIKTAMMMRKGAMIPMQCIQIPKMALITTSSVSERSHVGGSVARRFIMLLAERGEIQTVAKSHAHLIYTRIPAAAVAVPLSDV